MKTLLVSLVLFLTLSLKPASSACPHVAALTNWSSIYSSLGENDNVTVTTDVLLDKDVSLFSIHVGSNAKLVVHPAVGSIEVHYILVEGELHIGSEDCQFSGKLTITLKGTESEKYSMDGLTCQKCINVIKGGTLEIHGEYKRPWTKLAETVHKIPDSATIYYEKADKPKSESDQNKVGLLVRSFNSVTGHLKESKDLRFRGNKAKIAKSTKEFQDLAQEENNDCVVLAIRKAIAKKDDSNIGLLQDLFDEIETLGFGRVTNQSCIREHTFYDAYVMVACKGDTSLTKESCGEYRLGNTFQKVEECLYHGNHKFCGTSFSNSKNHGKSFAIFEVTKKEYTLPKITLAQEPDNWLPGDELCITSTDYDWEQLECGRIVQCSDCNSHQVQVDLTMRYDHYCKLVDNVHMCGEVFVNTRNVRVTSEMENFDAENGGMLKFSEGFSTVKVENSELEKLGDSALLGVYPLHYHLCKNVSGTYLRNNAVHDSWSRCFVVHGTMGAIVDRNTCSICKGHAFFTEDGVEKRTSITNNLGVGTLKANPKIFTHQDRFPATFLISNPNVEFTGNIAAGGVAIGIYILFPEKATGASKDFGIMERDEAKRTPMSVDNIAVHSYSIGFRFADRLSDKNKRQMYNKYQPEDDSGNRSPTIFKHITVFKSRDINAFVEGGLVEITQSSFADSPVGFKFGRNFFEGSGNLFVGKEAKPGEIREKSGQKPSLTKSVIVGDSDNKGNPQSGNDRSLPDEDNSSVRRCGIVVTSGVWSVDNTWFGGFNKTDSYDSAAICFEDEDKLVVSPRNRFKNVAFGFEDPTVGYRVFDNYRVSNLTTAEVGNKVAIFYDEDGKVTSKQGAFVVQPTSFHLSSNSEIRNEWQMAISEDYFAQVRVVTQIDKVTMMRSDKETQTSPAKDTAAFNVITGNDYHYIMKLSKYDASFIIGGVGISKSNSVVIGVCVPRNSEVNVNLFMPSFVKEPSTAVSKDDFFAYEHDYFVDKDVGVVLFRMKHTDDFADDGVDECPKGLCSRAHFSLKTEIADKADLDCFSRYTEEYLNGTVVKRRRRRKRRSTNVLPSSALDPDWGAKQFVLVE